MTVSAYALDGMSPERAAELGIDFPPSWLAVTPYPFPAVGLYSDRLNQWSNTVYQDAPDLTSDAWVTDPLYEADLADAVADTLAAQLDADLAANITFLGRSTFPSAVINEQVKALTRQMDALIRIERGLLDSTQGA